MTRAPDQLVPENVSEKDLKDEVLKRNSRAGYCTRYGESPCRTKIMSQPTNEQFRNNFDRISWND